MGAVVSETPHWQHIKMQLLLMFSYITSSLSKELGHKSFSNFPVVAHRASHKLRQRQSQGTQLKSGIEGGEGVREARQVQTEPRSYQDPILNNYANEDSQRDYPSMRHRQRQETELELNTELGGEAGAREARQVEDESNSYQDYAEENYLDDTFIEEAVFLSPSDRGGRDIAEGELLLSQEADLEEEFYQDESLLLSSEQEAFRDERDHLGSRGGRQRAQEQREGRQTGVVAPALGVLNNPSDATGNYNFNFANNDGSSRQEVGSQSGIEGSYSFITPEGEEVRVEYVADETGFHATGSHLPQAPPMPPAIARMLRHLEKVNGVPIVGY